MYLDEHLLRSFNQKNSLDIRLSGFRPKNLRRRMSCRGAIKKTRSINVDSEYKGERMGILLLHGFLLIVLLAVT